MNKKIAIIGAGGHGKVIGEIASLNKYETINFFYDRANSIKEFLFTPIKTLEYLNKNLKDYDSFFVAIGDNQIRSYKINWLKNITQNVFKISVAKTSSTTVGLFISAIENKNYLSAVINYENLTVNQKFYFEETYKIAKAYEEQKSFLENLF